ncbi:MAG: ferrous iron transport protein B [Armatimonadetes bacterium]|nr:ferrous iron transport protein B [Armatimonadota bacterium]
MNIKENKIVLVGNPNVGKSVIFGLLTGKYVTVSNYPGTTVEVTKGYAVLENKKCIIFDSPGINSFIPQSEDEKVTRDILLNQKIDKIIQVADAKNITRTLLIALQLAEIGLPFVLDLNMIDEAREKRINIDEKELSKKLGIPIVSTIATQNQGIAELKETLKNLKRPDYHIKYDSLIEEALLRVEKFLPESQINKRALSLMLLAGDLSLKSWLKENLSQEKLKFLEEVQEDLAEKYIEPLAYIINEQRLKETENLIKSCVKTEKIILKNWVYYLGRISMDRFWGIPILIIVLFLMYKFVGEFAAGAGVNFVENTVFGKYLNPWAIKIVNFLIPIPLIKELFVGEYGIFTMAITYALAIVMPIVTAFFLFFGILEDSGYLPRLAIMANRFCKIMGLNGKAVLPLVLGLGCDTMATITARILETKKEKIIVTLLLALGIPCSAQLGVILAMLAKLSFSATLLWVGIVLAVILLVGYLASKVLPGKGGDFILEIPPLRIPKLSNILIKTLARLEWYLKEAVPLFILGTLLLFVLDKIKMLKVIEKMASPLVVGFLGLPSRASESFIIGFLRRDYGAAGLYALADKGLMNHTQIVVSLVTITLFVPCIAQFFVSIKERGLKTALLISFVTFFLAFLIGGLVNFILHYLGIIL